MPKIGVQLELNRCPHCGVNTPNLSHQTRFETNSTTGEGARIWALYTFQRCGGVVTTYASINNNEIIDYYPKAEMVDNSIPKRAAEYLSQALESLHAPVGAIMLAACSVDAMLKAKNYKKGSLYSRIDKAAENHLITKEMASWAHEIRLDANDQRHADEGASLPTDEDAKRVVDFALALAEFLFVLPAKVQRGIKKSKN